MRLLIISHVVHYRYKERIYAYGPYAKEIELWADLFAQVIVAAPCRREAPPGDCLPFEHANIIVLPQRETGGLTLKAKAVQIFWLPRIVMGLLSAARRADAIHVRCPGNLGLLGVLLAPLCSRRLVAKYAGQWGGYPGEPLSVRLQRWLLRSAWWHGPVTVYGHWPNQPEHVIPFFTSMLTREQLTHASIVALSRNGHRVERLLYVGRLSESKHVDTILEAMAVLRAQGIRLDCSIVGDGTCRPMLERQVQQLGLDGRVDFVGGLDFECVQEFYENCDVLILVSETEGWPKAIAEAMAYGMVCIGSNRGLVPEMLGDGRGLVVSPGNAEQLAAALKQIVSSPGDFQVMRQRAAVWAARHSTEDLRAALEELLARHWKVPLSKAKRSVGVSRGAYT